MSLFPFVQAGSPALDIQGVQCVRSFLVLFEVYILGERLHLPVTSLLLFFFLLLGLIMTVDLQLVFCTTVFSLFIIK